MSISTPEGARASTEKYLDEEVRPKAAMYGIDDLVVTEVQEFEHCFVAFFNSRRFLDSGNLSDALAGNGPLIVNKRTGAVRAAWSGRAWEEQLDEL